MRWWVNLLLIVCLQAPQSLAAQNEYPDSLNRKNLRTLVISESVIYTGSMIALYSAWYKNQGTGAFHSFDDSKEWLQMDKAGHFLTSGYLSGACTEAFRYTGMNRKKAALLGTLESLIFMSSLETFDGFSSAWGFSWSDMGANALGCGLFLGQELVWREQRIRLKFSVHTTGLAQYRPVVLGKNYAERILKDYNGQTYWLSANISSFLRKENKFPEWINLAFGYGAQGMLGGTENPLTNEAGIVLPVMDRYRQSYLSFDVDFAKIPVKANWLRFTLRMLNFIKLPFPALEFSNGGVQVIPFFF